MRESGEEFTRVRNLNEVNTREVETQTNHEEFNNSSLKHVLESVGVNLIVKGQF